jgi:fengycin family lipopeptide synthetase D
MDDPHRSCSELLWDVRRLLGDDQLDMDSDLLATGPDSLKLVQIAELLSVHLGRNVQINEIWTAPTLRSLTTGSAETLERQTVVLPGLDRSASEAAGSPQQRRFYAVHQPEVTTLSQVVSSQVPLGRRADSALARKIVRYLVSKYDALANKFEWDGKNLWRIEVEDADFEIEEIDLSICREGWNSRYQDFLAAEAAWIYDPRQWPLFRCHVVQSPDQTIFSFHAHHLIFDGMSRPILQDEAKRLSVLDQIGQAARVEPLAFNYSDYAGWANNRAGTASHRRAQEYWTRVFDPTFRPLHLARSENASAVDARAAGYVFRLPRKVAEAARARAAEWRTTTFTILLGGFISYLLQDCDDVTIGVPAAGRDHPQARPIIGMFTNTLLVRVCRREAGSFRDLVALVHERLVGAQENQQFQYDEIVRMLGLSFSPNRLSLSGVYFNMVKEDLRVVPGDAEVGSHYEVGGGMIAELMMHYQEKESDIIFNVRYRSAAFPQTAVEQFCTAYGRRLVKM